MIQIKEYIKANKLAITVEEILIMKNIHYTFHYSTPHLGENLKLMMQQIQDQIYYTPMIWELTINSLFTHSPDRRDDSEKVSEKKSAKMLNLIEDELK